MSETTNAIRKEVTQPLRRELAAALDRVAELESEKGDLQDRIDQLEQELYGLRGM